MKRISYDEMLELASLGAGVMHSRSIEFAKKFNVPIHVRSSFSDVPGTMIVAEPESADQAVCGAALVKDEARITIEGVPDQPGMSHRHFFTHRQAQHRGRHDRAKRRRRRQSRYFVHRAARRCADHAGSRREAAAETRRRAVSATTTTWRSSRSSAWAWPRQTGVAQQMFHALGDAGVNIETITTSEIKITVLVARDQALAALRAVHAAFGLDKAAHATASPAIPVLTPYGIDASWKSFAQLQGMEDLTIDEITLDETQARVSIDAVPDQPGTAAGAVRRSRGRAASLST